MWANWTKEADYTTTVNENGEALGMLDLMPGSTVSSYEDPNGYTWNVYRAYGWNDKAPWTVADWACEVWDEEGATVATWNGDSPRDAMENAAIEAAWYENRRTEDNAEDLINAVAYGAYAMFHTNAMPSVCADDYAEQLEDLDRAMGKAIKFTWNKREEWRSDIIAIYPESAPALISIKEERPEEYAKALEEQEPEPSEPADTIAAQLERENEAHNAAELLNSLAFAARLAEAMNAPDTQAQTVHELQTMASSLKRRGYRVDYVEAIDLWTVHA